MAERPAIALPAQRATGPHRWRPLTRLLLVAACLMAYVCTPAAQQGYPPPPGSYDSEYTPSPQRSTATDGAAKRAKRDDGGSVPPGAAPPPQTATGVYTYGSATRFGAPPTATRHSDDPPAATARAVRRPSADAAIDSSFIRTPSDDAGVYGDYAAGGFRPAVGPNEWDSQRAAPAYPTPLVPPRGTYGTGTPLPKAPARPVYPAPAGGPATSTRSPRDSTASGFYPGPADATNRPAYQKPAPAEGAVFRPVN
jgi:hypothetical protein